MNEPLIIKGCNLGHPRKTDRDDENLAFFAPACLNDFYQDHHPTLLPLLGIGDDADQMTRMMAVLPYIAEYYNLDKDTLLSAWVSEHGMMHMRNMT